MRLNNKAPAPAKSAIKAAPLLDLPPQIIIDDWLKRDRERRKPQEEKEQRIRIPLDMPHRKPRDQPGIREPEEIIIDLNKPANTLN